MLIDNATIQKCTDMLINIEQVAMYEFVKGLDRGEETSRYIEELMVSVMFHIGVQWQQGNIALSQVYMSGIICEDIIKRVFKNIKRPPKNHQRIGTAVLEDSHTLGIKLVHQILTINGYEYIDLGYGLTIDEIELLVNENKIDVLLVSVLMLPSAMHIQELRGKLGNQVKIIVGGAPFRLDKELWKKVGADGFGLLASDVIHVIEGVTAYE